MDSFLDDLEDLARDDEEEARIIPGDDTTSNAALYESDDDSPILDAVAEYFNTAGSSSHGFSPMVKDRS